MPTKVCHACGWHPCRISFLWYDPTPPHLASCHGDRLPVTDAQFVFAAEADAAFAGHDPTVLGRIAGLADAPLLHLPAAACQWLQEQPEPETGLGRLDRLILEAVRARSRRPRDIFQAVSASDTPPQFWGDTALGLQLGVARRKPNVPY